MNAVPRTSWRHSWMRLQGQLTAGRKIARMTQQQLADCLCVDRRTIQRWEDGDTDPSTLDLYRWADAVGLSITAAPISECDSSAASSLPARAVSRIAHLTAPLPNHGEDAAAGRTFHGKAALRDFRIAAGSDAR